MTEQQEMMVDLYRKGVSVREISQVTGITERSISSIVTRLRVQGVDIPYRKTMKPSKKVITSKKCEYKPGRACLNCPYDRCIANGKGLTEEEKEMFKAGLPPQRRTKDEIEVDEYYG